MYDVKIINKCKLDKKGHPTIIAGTAAMTMLYDFPEFYSKAKKKECNIIKRPLLDGYRLVLE
jgi:hypothetical protein